MKPNKQDTGQWDTELNVLISLCRPSSQIWKFWPPFLQLLSMTLITLESPTSFSSTQVSSLLEQSFEIIVWFIGSFFPPNVFIMDDNKGNNEVILHSSQAGQTFPGYCIQSKNIIFWAAWRTCKGSEGNHKKYSTFEKYNMWGKSNRCEIIQ